METLEKIIALATAAVVPLGALAAGVWQVVLRNDKRNAATPPVVQGQSVPLDLATYATGEVAELRAELAVTRARKRAYRDELLRLDQDPDEVLHRAGIID